MKVTPAPAGVRIGTAAKGSQLRVRGIGEPTVMTLGPRRRYTIRPLVIDNLSHDFNIGMTFLCTAEMKMKCGTDPVLIDADGESIPMVNAMTMATEEMNQSPSETLVAEEIPQPPSEALVAEDPQIHVVTSQAHVQKLSLIHI